MWLAREHGGVVVQLASEYGGHAGHRGRHHATQAIARIIIIAIESTRYPT